MSIRPTDMQQIFSKENIIEQMHQNMQHAHEQQQIASAINQQKAEEQLKTKETGKENKLRSENSEDSQKENEQTQHQGTNHDHEEENEENDNSQNRTEGSIIDVLV